MKARSKGLVLAAALAASLLGSTSEAYALNLQAFLTTQLTLVSSFLGVTTTFLQDSILNIVTNILESGGTTG